MNSWCVAEQVIVNAGCESWCQWLLSQWSWCVMMNQCYACPKSWYDSGCESWCVMLCQWLSVSFAKPVAIMLSK